MEKITAICFFLVFKTRSRHVSAYYQDMFNTNKTFLNEIFLSEKFIQYEIVSKLVKYKNIYKLKYIPYQICKPKVKDLQNYYIHSLKIGF